MTNHSHDQPNQSIEISNSVLESVQIAQAGRDLHLTQIQGGVASLTVFGSVQVDKATLSTSQAFSKEEYKWRRVLLSKVQHFWIDGVLKKSVYLEFLIELGLANRNEYVWNPVNGAKEFSLDSLQSPPLETSLEEMFSGIGDGRTLLILGEPGAGKTVTLLKLAESLIDRAREDFSQPLPVVINLSSWAKERKKFGEWLVQELYTIYQVTKSLGRTWVEKEQLILLLDGLDEVEEKHRNSCVFALNQFIQDHGRTEMVVCSRIRDYEALSEKLKLRSAIYVRPPTWEQINQYLMLAGESLSPLRAILEQSESLREFASSPLILNIMSITYQDTSLDALELVGTSEEQNRQQLFDAYIERMLVRRGTTQKYSKAQVIKWMAWLSSEMKKSSQTVFFIEKIQPSQLSFRFSTVFFRLINAIATGIIYSLAIILVGGIFDILIILMLYKLTQEIIGETAFLKIDSLFSGPLIGNSGWFTVLACGTITGLAWGILEALIYGLIANKPSRIRVGDQIKWSWSEAKKGFLNNLLGVFVITSASIILFGFLLIVVSVFTGEINKAFGDETLGELADGSWWSKVLFVLVFANILFIFNCLLLFVSIGCVKLFIKRVKDKDNPSKKTEDMISLRRRLRSFLINIKLSRLIILFCFNSFLGLIAVAGGEQCTLWYLIFHFIILTILSSAVISAAVLGLIIGLISALFSGLRKPSIDQKYSYPNQGVLEAGKNALIFGTTLGLLVGIIVGGIFRLKDGAISNILIALILSGLIGSLIGGGTSCIKHLVLRIFLFREDKIPWNYANFLNYAVERIFLRKVGGGYIFIHRMLLEHFAAIETKS